MIKQAAIKVENEILTLPRPARHHNIIWAINDVLKLRENGQIIVVTGEQGFIDENGNFLTREEAAIHARETGQLKKPLTAPPRLFSEDLW